MNNLILTITISSFIFFSHSLVGHHFEDFDFELPHEADLVNDFSAIFMIYDVISIKIERAPELVMIQPLLDLTHPEKDTLMKIDLTSAPFSFQEHQITFEERENLELFLLTPIDRDSGYYELLVRYKFDGLLIRFRGKHLTPKGIEALLLIKETIDYTPDVEILKIRKDQCGEFKEYSQDTLWRFGYQILDLQYQSNVLTFKLVKMSNCCEQPTYYYTLKATRNLLLITKDASNPLPFSYAHFNYSTKKWDIFRDFYDQIVREECECDCLFCYSFELETKKEFKELFFRE